MDIFECPVCKKLLCCESNSRSAHKCCGNTISLKFKKDLTIEEMVIVVDKTIIFCNGKEINVSSKNFNNKKDTLIINVDFDLTKDSDIIEAYNKMISIKENMIFI